MKYTGKQLVEYIKENNLMNMVLTALKGNNQYNYFMLPILGNVVAHDGNCDFMFVMADGGIGRITIANPDIEIFNMASAEDTKYVAFYCVEKNRAPQLSFANGGKNDPGAIVEKFLEDKGIDTHGKLKKLIVDGALMDKERKAAFSQNRVLQKKNIVSQPTYRYPSQTRKISH